MSPNLSHSFINTAQIVRFHIKIKRSSLSVFDTKCECDVAKKFNQKIPKYPTRFPWPPRKRKEFHSQKRRRRKNPKDYKSLLISMESPLALLFGGHK